MEKKKITDKEEKEKEEGEAKKKNETVKSFEIRKKKFLIKKF